ncbi:hypothetical protein AB5N19_11508 [Seiridium cardinale]|uniref:Uncharacterized protein n=1 Tax=Seiridium cardinale TaxID=138064 RepID=A0ABR2XUU1_9PEZI
MEVDSPQRSTMIGFHLSGNSRTLNILGKPHYHYPQHRAKVSKTSSPSLATPTVWIIYPDRTDSNGNQGVAELLYNLGEKARNVIAIYSDISEDGKFAYFTLTTADHIAALDINDLNNITPDQKHIVVTDYFVQTGDIGVINTPADFKALYIDILDDGSLSFNRSINFQREFANRGGAKPHSAVVFDFTDPSNPIYY